MNRRDALRERKAELVKQCETILDQADENGGLTDEQEETLHAAESSLDSVNAALDREEKQADRQRGLEAVRTYGDLANDLADTPTQIEGDDEPSVNPADKHKWKSFAEFLHAVVLSDPHHPDSNRDNRLVMQAAATGLNEGVPADGGFLLPTDFSTALLGEMHEMGSVLSRVRPIPLDPRSIGIKLPMIDETSRANGSRFGGVTAGWVGEAATTTAGRPKFRQLELNLKKLLGLGYITDELMNDTTAMEAVMRPAFAEEMTFKTEDAFINGDGSGKPLGLLNSGALISVAAESGQAAATIVRQNIYKMWNRLPLRSRRNAVWLINQDIEPQLFELNADASSGLLLFRPPGVEGPSTNTAPSGTLLGRPVIPTEYNATLGTVGDILLVDLSQYLMINKQGVRQDTSMHVRFLFDELVFRIVFRVDGQPAWNTAVTPFKGTNTVSPYVGLATRS